MTDHVDDGWRCPRCGSAKWGSASLTGPVSHGGIPIRQCTPCGYYSSDRADLPYTPPTPRPKSLSIGVDDELLAMLQAEADEHGRTVTQTVRWLVRQALDPDAPMGNATRRQLAEKVRRLKRAQMTQGLRIQDAKRQAAQVAAVLDELYQFAGEGCRAAVEALDLSEGSDPTAVGEADAYRSVCLWIDRARAEGRL